MDEGAVERVGLESLTSVLAAIAGIANQRDALAFVASHQGASGHTALLSLDVAPDHLDPTRYILNLGSPELGLMDRAMYLDPRAARLRQAYRLHVQAVLEYAGWMPTEVQRRVPDLVAFETELAKIIPDRAWLRRLGPGTPSATLTIGANRSRA